MNEELTGGYQSKARRVGDVVHRGRLPEYAVGLLKFLAAQGWPSSPRIVSAGQAESVLEYVEGIAAITPDLRQAAALDAPLAAVAALVREFHDLTAGSVYAAGAQVACHNDLDPRNTVYRASGPGLAPIALIDWDIAGPGDRIHDLAHVCWTYTRLGPGADVALIEHRLDVVMGAYRWYGSGAEVVDAMLWWQDRCWRGIVAEADAGDSAMRALVGNGIVGAVKSDYSWTKENLLRSV